MEDKVPKGKISYEQLEQIAFQLRGRVIQLEEQMSTTQMTAMRLKYLFDVLDRAKFFTARFVDNCISEITDILEIKKEDNNPTESTKE